MSQFLSSPPAAWLHCELRRYWWQFGSAPSCHSSSWKTECSAWANTSCMLDHTKCPQNHVYGYVVYLQHKHGPVNRLLQCSHIIVGLQCEIIHLQPQKSRPALGQSLRQLEKKPNRWRIVSCMASSWTIWSWAMLALLARENQATEIQNQNKSSQLTWRGYGTLPKGYSRWFVCVSCLPYHLPCHASSRQTPCSC